MGFITVMQGGFNTQHVIAVFYYINRLERNTVGSKIYAEGSIWQHSKFILDKKTFSNLRIYKNILNMIKELYRKPIDNIRVSGEILNAFPRRLGKREGLLLFNIIPEVLFNVIMRKKKRKEKPSVFVDSNCLCRKS